MRLPLRRCLPFVGLAILLAACGGSDALFGMGMLFVAKAALGERLDLSVFRLVASLLVLPAAAALLMALVWATRALERVLPALEEQFAEAVYRSDEDLIFGHPELGSPLDPSALSRNYLRPALAKAKITKAFRVWHDLRHTALTHEAAAGNPAVYVQLKAGHAQGSTTERYIHAAQVLFPGAADRGEDRIFAGIEADG